MKDKHIISILESGPLSGLTESELANIRLHATSCERCRLAFDAAQISPMLIKERAAQVIEPPPFFNTRVLAALRERQATNESWASSFRRLWKATGALISSMAVTVAALALFTFVAPSLESTEQGSTADTLSAEEVILAHGDQEDELSYDQVLTAIYETELDAER
jgi:hypothetical protein